MLWEQLMEDLIDGFQAPSPTSDCSSCATYLVTAAQYCIYPFSSLVNLGTRTKCDCTRG